MKRIVVGTGSKYEILLGRGMLSKFLHNNNYYKIAFLADSNSKKFADSICRKMRNAVKIVLPPGEKHKNIRTVEKVWKFLVSRRFDRKSLLICVGGGVITDVGGFVAGTYMRGMDFVNIPTTLLAMVDASVGGKTGINFEGIKNIIGCTKQPKAVLIDVDVLKTLPERVFVSGFAEIIKHGIIKDEKYFRLAAKKPPKQFTKKELEKIVAVSCSIKAGIVKSDENETGERKLLNYGHTVGHAIESLAKGRLMHGEAVAIGMVAEAKLSQLLGMLREKDLHRIERAIVDAGLPVIWNGAAINSVLQKMLMDKKNLKGKIMWTLPEKIGRAKYNVVAPKQKILAALRYVL